MNTLLHRPEDGPTADIYVLPVLDSFLLYAPLKKLAALVNAEAVSRLATWIEGGRGVPVPGLESLCSELLEPDRQAAHGKTGAPSPAFLGIIPSRRCNLACTYCSFGAAEATGDCMDLGMASSAVAWMAESCSRRGTKRLDIHFFGGEPLVSPEVVEVVVHKARAMAGRLDLVPCFELSTNGLCDESFAGFIGDCFDTVVLSLDGPAEIHDRHRPRRGGRGSLDAVTCTARILASSPVDLCIRACISSISVDRMEEMAGWFCSDFQPSVINFETLQPVADMETTGLLPPDPYAFATHFVRAAKLAERAGFKAIYATADIGKTRLSFCPVGNDTLIVSPDGRISSCYLPEHEWQARGLDLNVGSIDGRGVVELNHEKVEYLRRMVKAAPARCTRCFCRWTCAAGCRVNHSFPDCPTTYDDLCIQTRVITACNLLAALGLPGMSEYLVASRAAMEQVALQSSDRLAEWEGQDE
jgi:uncharacterized protein